MTRVLVALVLMAGVGCGAAIQRHATDIAYLRGIVHGLDCGDRQPARVLTDPLCRDGICGISCAPDRWTR